MITCSYTLLISDPAFATMKEERSIVKRAHIYNFFGSRDIVEFDKKRLPALSSRLNFGAVAIELIIWAPVNDVEEVNERRAGSETNTTRIRSD